jgi:hypothetical protein
LPVDLLQPRAAAPKPAAALRQRARQQVIAQAPTAPTLMEPLRRQIPGQMRRDYGTCEQRCQSKQAAPMRDGLRDAITAEHLVERILESICSRSWSGVWRKLR